MDTLLAGENRGLKAGKLVVLSKNFPGSDRDVQQVYGCNVIGC